jgi:phage terminase large subunit
MKINFNRKLFNPLFWHIFDLLSDPKIRYIYVEGGSSAAKTYSICQAILIHQYLHDYFSVVFRSQHVDIKDSIYSSFNMAAAGLELKNLYYIFQEDLIKSTDDKAGVRFRGLDNEENIKGIEKFNVCYLNEFNQFTEPQWDQLRKRLRGRPNQKFIADWNPISSKLWQYENWLDTDQWEDLPLTVECGSKYNALNPEFAFKKRNLKGDSIWIKVTYRDNFWIVGHPSGKGGLVDQHTLDDFERDRLQKPNLYRIYANGERGIMRTGGEFWKSFREDKHTGKVEVTDTTIHITCDQNALPYAAISAWQLQEMQLTQVNEFPCKAPDNNAVKSAQTVIKWLQRIEYEDVVYVYGDPSGNNRNVIDENGLSYYDKFISELKKAGYHVVRRIGKSHPRVAMSAEFINDIYEHELDGYSIMIGDHCTTSIDDYIDVKEDKDGAMLKIKVKDKLTEQTYEKNGHFSDGKRYFICSILSDVFEKYIDKSNRIKIYSW